MGWLTTGALLGGLVFGFTGKEAQAQTITSPISNYQVLIKESDGKQNTISFTNKKDFENYLSNHSIQASTLHSLSSIYSTFYVDFYGQGANLPVNASKNPYVITNLNSTFNDKVSSVRTHPYGDYTILYQNMNGQGYGLAIPNNGYLYNLTYPLGDGKHTWNDETSSVLVKSY
ncbi:hypothetical protein CON35_17350 [Bacillus cereus]|nr:hypothetical protein CON35_17350 [Bacillus cereus]